MATQWTDRTIEESGEALTEAWASARAIAAAVGAAVANADGHVRACSTQWWGQISGSEWDDLTEALQEVGSAAYNLACEMRQVDRVIAEMREQGVV